MNDAPLPNSAFFKEISVAVTIPNNVSLDGNLLSRLLCFHGRRPWQVVLSRKHYDELQAHYMNKFTCGRTLDKAAGRGHIEIYQGDEMVLYVPFKPGLFTQFHYDHCPQSI